MGDMIERVARAIDPATWENWDNWVTMKGYTADEKAEEFARSPSLHKSLARAAAAIEAMREPTASMLAGYIAAYEDATLTDWDYDPDARDFSPEDGWRTMVDAALSEPK